MNILEMFRGKDSRAGQICEPAQHTQGVTYLEVPKHNDDNTITVTCKHCGKEQTYSGKLSYKNCKFCGYKIFFDRDSGVLADPSIIAQGVTRLEINLKTDEDKIRLVPWGDVHIGAPEGQNDYAKAMRELQYVLDTPNTYLIGMGDFCDCAQKMPWKHGPNIFTSSLSPMEQYTVLERWLRPLAEAGKIIGLHAGNHETWIMENSGIQLIDLLCRSLRVPFLGAGCDLMFKVNDQKYYGYSQHGSSSAKLKHTKLGAVVSATKDIFADFF
jgi:predicted nucleic-acid-binding Zn-ribbon protein